MNPMSGAPMSKFRTTNAMLTSSRDTRIFSTGCAGKTGLDVLGLLRVLD